MAYRPIFDAALDELRGLWVDIEGAGAVNHAYWTACDSCGIGFGALSVRTAAEGAMHMNTGPTYRCGG